MSQIEIIKVPDIGDFDSVEIIEVLVAEGDSINVDDVIITLKAKKRLWMPSPASGVIKKVLVKLGDSVSQGTDMLELEISESTDKEPKAVDETAKVEKTEQAKVENRQKQKQKMPKEVTRKPPPVLCRQIIGGKNASPAIRKFARELGADINLIPGTGRKGRITKNDVKSFIKQAMQSGGTVQSGASNFDVLPPVNEDFSKYGDIESVSLSRIQKISGKYLHRNWVRIPHVTQFDEADITELEQFRQDSKDEAKAQGFGLSPLAFIVKAVAVALKKFPKFNSSLDAAEENLIMKKYYHIGIAVDTPNGLVVPVIRDVLGKTVMEIAREMSELSVKARDGKLAPSDMKGGCFSVSSLGGIGGTAFTPIINSPEVAILGVSRSQIKPVFNDKGEVKPRLMLPLSLSYDHRVIDGADAARFIVYLSTVLSDLKKMLL
ncbi:MAG: 2-oxo acid dehydrogenase subunit E2 [Gammaproteobacteria bacterium]